MKGQIRTHAAICIVDVVVVVVSVAIVVHVARVITIVIVRRAEPPPTRK